MIDTEELITNEVAAGLLGVRPLTLIQWRSEHRGPKYLKVGRRCYYRRTDISEWLKSQVRDPAARSGKAA